MSEGTPLPEVATLAESTVQAIASEEVAPTPKKRRKGAQKPASAIDTHAIKVNPAVWEKAQQLLAGSYSRIEIIDESTVVVR